MDTRRIELLQHGMPGASPLPASLRLKWLAAQEGQRSTISLERIESRLEAASQKRRVSALALADCYDAHHAQACGPATARGVHEQHLSSLMRDVHNPLSVSERRMHCCCM